jgi:hypothetical protein
VIIACRGYVIYVERGERCCYRLPLGREAFGKTGDY